MSLGRFYTEDIVGGVITSVVGTALIWAVQQIGELSVVVVLSTAVVLFVVFYLVKFLTRWVSFLVFSGLREACGLFIEIYVTEKDKRRAVVVAPMLVYFDVRSDNLAVRGHAFQHRGPTGKFSSYANWRSLAVVPKPHMDDFGLFYLHDGELVGEKSNDVPGTTFCRLPRRSANRCRQGYFCDLVQVTQALDTGRENVASLSYFEIVRASPDLEQQFLAGIRRPFERWHCRLGLASPREDAFASFVNRHGDDLIISDNVERGRIMRQAKQLVESRQR